MSKDIKQVNSVKPKIYKKREFRAFLKAIEYKQAAHWADIARAIGVDQDTIAKWRQIPEAQEAIAKGLQAALDGMETAGRKDWRMHHEKYKLLAGKEDKVVEINDPVVIILKQFGLIDEPETKRITPDTST